MYCTFMKIVSGGEWAAPCFDGCMGSLIVVAYRLISGTKKRRLTSLRPQSCELPPMQDADAECRMQNRPQSCELHPMQDADAECRMQKRAQSYSSERRAGCRMQSAECKNSPTARRERTEYRCRMQVQNAKTPSPNIGRRGQEKSRTECTMQVQNTESHPRVHCVCREGLYGADALYTDCNLHATCLPRGSENCSAHPDHTLIAEHTSSSL